MSTNNKAFTLIELLVVIGIIAILVGAVVIAISPGERLAEARDATRERHLQAIEQAIYTYQIDHLGSFNGMKIPSQTTEICNTEVVNPEECKDKNLVNLYPLVEGGYISSIPIDPQINQAEGVGYKITLIGERISLVAQGETKNVLTGPIIIAFTEMGSHVWEVPKDITEVDVLVVAGGGGGGGQANNHNPGGGGGGGLIFKPSHEVVPGSEINIEVGKGGEGEVSGGDSDQGEDGESSSFEELVSIGGGGGGNRGADGRDGGSGGGARGVYGNEEGKGIQPTRAEDSGEFGFGNDGGIGTGDWNCGGGGGGAGEVGHKGCVLGERYGGFGGDGLYLGDVFGKNHGDNGWFAAGGGGGAGDGGPEKGGSGGSGIVLVRYEI